MTALMAQLKALPVSERVELVGYLWDSIEEDSAPLTLTEVEIKELERRSAELAANPDIGIPWEVAKRRLLGQHP